MVNNVGTASNLDGLANPRALTEFEKRYRNGGRDKLTDSISELTKRRSPAYSRTLPFPVETPPAPQTDPSSSDSNTISSSLLQFCGFTFSRMRFNSVPWTGDTRIAVGSPRRLPPYTATELVD